MTLESYHQYYNNIEEFSAASAALMPERPEMLEDRRLLQMVGPDMYPDIHYIRPRMRK